MTKSEFLETKELGKCGELGVFYSPRSQKHVCNKSLHLNFLFPLLREWWGSAPPTLPLSPALNCGSLKFKVNFEKNEE